MGNPFRRPGEVMEPGLESGVGASFNGVNRQTIAASGGTWLGGVGGGCGHGGTEFRDDGNMLVVSQVLRQWHSQLFALSAKPWLSRIICVFIRISVWSHFGSRAEMAIPRGRWPRLASGPGDLSSRTQASAYLSADHFGAPYCPTWLVCHRASQSPPAACTFCEEGQRLACE